MSWKLLMSESTVASRKKVKKLKKRFWKLDIYWDKREKNPVVHVLTLKLNKRKLTEQEVDEIIGKYNSEPLATNEIHVSQDEVTADDDIKSTSSQVSKTSSKTTSIVKTVQTAALRKTTPTSGRGGAAQVVTRNNVRKSK